jgi:hypothetical protein
MAGKSRAPGRVKVPSKSKRTPFIALCIPVVFPSEKCGVFYKVFM